MYIYEKIYAKAIDKAKELTVKDVRIGLGYIIVELDNGWAGISYSFLKELNIQTCTVLESAGSLIGEKASFLLEGLFSYNLLDCSLALASANAIINSSVESVDIDIINQIESEDRVVMVGYFAPLIKAIQNQTKSFVICERTPRGESLPDYAAYFELKKADIAIITATSIINKTIDSLLEWCKSARIVAIMGPSTPMDEDIFKGKATHLCGSLISDNEKAKLIISQAGGTKKLKPAIKKACVLV